MATSGYTDVAVTNNDTLRFYWSLSGQSTESNYSIVPWEMQLITDAYGTINSTALKAWSVNVDGQAYSGTNTVGISKNSTKTLASGSKIIYHNAEGDKSFSYSFSQQFSVTLSSVPIGTVSGSGSGDLPRIARSSQPSVSASSVTMGNSITIYTNRASSSFTHNIYYNWKNNNYTTGLSATSGISDSLTFTPPKSLANNIPNNQSSTCTIYCDTYNGGTYIGTKSCTITINISSDIKPTVSAVVTDANGYATTFGGYVVGKSKYIVQLTEAGSYSSSIASRTITMNGATYTANPSTSNVLLAVGNNSAVCQVRDLRGVYSDALTKTMTVIDYSVPAINAFSVSRCTSDGTANDEGEYAKVTYNVSITALNNHNTKSLIIKYKKVVDASYTQQTITMTSYSQSSSFILSGIDGLYSYDFVLIANDYFNIPTEKSQVISTAKTLVDFKGDDAIAFGKIAEHENLFECELPAQFNNGISGQGINNVQAYNYGNGYLAATNMSATSDCMFRLEITGNGYGSSKSLYTVVEGYNYNSGNSMMNCHALALGLNFNVDVFNYNGFIYFWFPNATSYMSVTLWAVQTNTTDQSNRITSITNAAKPTTGVTRSVTITPVFADSPNISGSAQMTSQGGGIWMHDETDNENWQVHVHGDTLRLYNGSVEKIVSLRDSENRKNIRLNRRDSDDSVYTVQTYWNGAYWILEGYANDSYHAPCHVHHSTNADYAYTSYFGGGCAMISGQDCLAVRPTGFYMGENCPNQVDGSWHYYIVLQHNADWMVVISIPLTVSGTIKWRAKRAGTWGAWYGIAS